MHLEIITPESKIFSGEAEAVQFPGLDGSFQVLDNHAAIISALAKGVVKANLNTAFSSPNSNELIKVDASDKKVIRVEIKGGVMEMQNNKVIVLAE
ncbi:MAG: F0F1 ATP synthase subunit epsilon [Flavobacteriales bacterium]|nr:F0F1 ATP synthase subunit epsilon [Crocinitomicaceae bacterium]|tara:strand:- start:308 stop:595 length:288 start_codon:yes stop_codon:yes gene_type:complete